jgi:hypothetical protein
MTKRGKFWALLGILIFLLLNYPLLQIFNRDTLLGGIPLLILYLLGVWLLAIAGLYRLSRRLTAGQPGQLGSKADVK